MTGEQKSGKGLTKTVSTTTRGTEKKTRNQYPTYVYGISAPNEFWSAVEQYAQERGLTRSSAVVELVQRGVGRKAPPASKAVGRPKKKTVKVQQ